MSATFSSKEFNKVLKKYQDLSGKTMADVLNRTATSIAMRASGRTPTMRKIWPVRDVDAPKKLIKYTKTGRKRKNVSSGGNRYENRLYFALASEKGARKGGGKMAKAAQRIYARARQASGYTGAAWGPAIADLGGNLKKKQRKFLRHGDSREGGAEKATERNHRCVIKNTAGGSEKVGFKPMVEAAEIVFADRVQYIARKLQDAADRAAK